MCTASIWHMATISVDRYCSLRFPLRYRRTRTPLFVVAKIAFVWIVSVGICSTLAIAGFINPFNVYRRGQCAPAVPEFVIYGSIFAFYVPLILMLVSYALTVRTLRNTFWRRRSLQFKVAKARTGGARVSSVISLASDDTEVNQSVESLCTRVRADGQCAIDSQPRASSVAALDRITTDHSDRKEFIAQRRPTHQRNDGKALYGASSTPVLALTSQDRTCAPDVRPKYNRFRSAARAFHSALRTRPVERRKLRQMYMTGGAPNRASHRPQQSSTRRTKRKATRVLGVMFLVFVVLWTPFFVLNVLSAVCPRCVRSVAPEVWTVLVWLGWVSSFANPIIYTSFSPAFRSAFKRLLTCRCEQRKSQAERRQQQWTSQLTHSRTRTVTL